MASGARIMNPIEPIPMPAIAPSGFGWYVNIPNECKRSENRNDTIAPTLPPTTDINEQLAEAAFALHNGERFR